MKSRRLMRRKPTKGQRCASQQNWPPNDRFGSKADITRRSSHVRFAPEGGQIADIAECLLCAKSGQMHRSKIALFDHPVGTCEQERTTLDPCGSLTGHAPALVLKRAKMRFHRSSC